MTPPPANVTRHFLGWDTPLLPAAVAWFTRGWTPTGALDLADALVVVPTRQAGRRLRAGLAAHAAKHGQAVFAPRVVQPETLLEAAAADAKAAPDLVALLAWVEVLTEADLDEFREVFPIDPPERNFAWALGLAEQFRRLQSTLAEAALGLGDVAARTAPGFGERGRWEQFGELARRQAAVLRRRGWVEPQAARIAAAAGAKLPRGCGRVVVVGVADPVPLALEALAALARSAPVEILIAAPEAEAEAFDGWGRPRDDAWARRDPPFADFAAQVHLLPDAAAQAEQIAEAARGYGDDASGRLGVAVADAEIASLAENALERAGLAAFDPAAEMFRRHGFHHLLRALGDFVREPGFAPALALARAPEVTAWLQGEIGAEFRVSDWLAQLDELRAEHLVETLADVGRHERGPLAARGLALLAELRAEARRGDPAEAAAGVVGRLFARRRFDLGRVEDRRAVEAIEAWLEAVRETAAAVEGMAAIGPEEAWELALARFGERRPEVERPAGAIDLQGWLELPFEDAPHVVVAGLNDGAIPEAVTGDVFLPESLRVRLGLKTNAARFARDAYLLHALVASRRAAGRVDVLLGKVSAAGDPRRPSRLLLQGAEEELPARVRRLFRPLESRAALPAWERAWRLAPRRVAPPARLSVTAFRSYLECPLRFLLKHGLKMEAFDAQKREMDVFDFGRLCHKPLERFAAAPWRDCTDERALAAMLVEELDREAEARYGREPAVPLVAQIESARQRLRAAARVQARLRAEGWVVHEVERKFELSIGGLPVRGQIDRVDRHEGTGAWRVIDYKTSDTAKRPVEAHLGSPWSTAPAWARLMVGTRELQWLDLQLPLYVEALPFAVPEARERAACGYFNLPKSASAAELALWEDYTVELHQQAMQCAEEVVAAVGAGVFGPPNEEIRAESDAFAALFHRGVAASLAAEVSP